ncbi:MAG: hypothetical protein ABI824_07730 [Acidobacteriota bacterium]
MSGNSDWRYRQIEGLQGCEFRFARYYPRGAGRDHDHCEGCWSKFAEADYSHILQEGYVTSLPARESPESEFVRRCRDQGMECLPPANAAGVRFHWVCARCFEDFRQMLRFSMEG